MEKKWLFDREWTRDFTGVRQEFIAEFLGTVRRQIELNTALDIGCGMGDSSKFLSDMGIRVVAVDGREENAREAQRRYPEIIFLTRNVEDLTAEEVGTFDFVQCVGILYHLENPFRAIRNIYSLTNKAILIETMCVPNLQPAMDLLDEGVGEDQGLNYVAFYPSELCLVKMLYRAGFSFVCRFKRLQVDELFGATLRRKRQRTFLAASKIALPAHYLVLVEEPFRYVEGHSDPWITRLSRMKGYGNARLFRLRVSTRRAGKSTTDSSPMTLDSYLRQHSIGTIDLIKIDVEDGEMDVFKGGENLLRQELRPVILCELQDVRTEAWGHRAKDTAAFIESFGFRWFRPLSDGSLTSSLADKDGNERNFVAIPPERMRRVKEMITDGSRP
jgi:SAM-dependent methyltransferase